jgi:hypothetical protein
MPSPGAVVLAHGGDGGRIVDGALVVRPRLLAHPRPGAVIVVPGVRVGIDDPVGVRGRIAQEEPVPPLGSEGCVTAG